MTTDDDDDRAREAEWRWGNTDAYAQSAKRHAAYGPADIERMKAESLHILRGMVALLERGVASSAPEAMAHAELLREHNSRWHYDTSHEMHAMLGEMYVADARFTKTYEDIAPGLAQYVSTAIVENAKRAGAKVAIDDALANVRAAMGLAGAGVEHVEEVREEKREHHERRRRR